MPNRAAPESSTSNCTSSDVNDLEALTPNHFLLGRSVSLVQTNDHSHRRVLRQADCYTELIWRRWLNEYVP